MDFLQIFTLLTGVVYMILEIRQKNLMWVVGILTSLAAMWVFFRQGLYASFALNTYYFITSFVGIWQWSQDKKLVASDIVVLNRLTFKVVILSAVVAVLGTIALSVGMECLHGAGLLNENPMSLLDSAIAVLSAVATWWLVKSYREQWWLWILADSLSVLLCVLQGMWWMAALYVAYVVAAVYGLRYWKKCGVYIGD